MPDIKGVDVASYQGAPGQWVNDAGAQGIQWAAVKITEVSAAGVYINPDAKADWDYLWEHKLGRIAYLYAHPSVSVSSTIATFKIEMDKLGLLAVDGVAVDLEVSDSMSPAAVASWAKELFSELHALYGRWIILYTYESFLAGGFCEGLQDYPLWIASITTPGLPNLPAPWKDWFAQQYTITGVIDQDVAHFSALPAMQAAMGAPQFETITAVYVTTGEESLINLSHLLQTPISTILRLTLNGSANHLFTTPLADYLDYGNFQLLMAKGITLRYFEQVKA